ncbi:MAG: M20/M25/M40 family metallo-hydrolase [Candidatus Marsarchaeota archaeon]|nr:M20/M25/M40 family metallo-hydrolase [Candidatus Marsarchaeota archaeon]MCL5413097.1 M20/M25/M40 family metallo-hydrolase [Candidatus Marsarchaeota archaeon]
MNVIRLTKELMWIPSLSGEEYKIGRFVADRLKKNLSVKLQRVGSGLNVIATVGTPRILLTTHLDTVPGNLAIREDSGFVYGRGACDAKGIAAAMICAAESAVESGIVDFGLLFDADEEGGFSGIRKAIGCIDAKTVVVGEPTMLRIYKGQKGLISARLYANGKSAPGSMPDSGISAINRLLDTLQGIRGLRFTKGTKINIGRINGGTSANVVADYASADMEIRTVEPNKNVLMRVNDVLGECRMVVSADYDPVASDRMLPYFSEMPYWSGKSDVMAVGPGNYSVAHSDKERVSKAQLKKGVEIYLDLISRFAR